jgi:hypothetical protein
MTVLKWLVVLAACGYLVGLAALFVAQRSFLFPIPQTVRTAPEAAGFGAAEEHLLTAADGAKIIVWHVPAKPGHAVVVYFPGNGDFLAGLVGRFRDITSDGTGAMPARAGAQASRGFFGMPRRPTRSHRRNTARIGLSSGDFRSAVALPSRWRQISGSQS